jgi:hypothetical protein
MWQTRSSYILHITPKRSWFHLWAPSSKPLGRVLLVGLWPKTALCKDSSVSRRPCGWQRANDPGLWTGTTKHLVSFPVSCSLPWTWKARLLVFFQHSRRTTTSLFVCLFGQLERWLGSVVATCSFPESKVQFFSVYLPSLLCCCCYFYFV